MRSFAVSTGLLALASALPSDDALFKRADTSNTPRPQFGNVPYGADITSCTLPNKIALTFDDGPSVYTEYLLDLFKAEGVKATFFVNGKNGGPAITEGSNPAILKRMVSEGHQIGSHTWSHMDLGAASTADRREELFKLESALVDIVGGIPTYFRPPYTSCGGDCMSDVAGWGYHIANYDLDTKDYENGGVNAKSFFTSGLENGNSFVVLAHDIHEYTTVGGFTKFMIEGAKKKGLDFVTMGECLGDAPENWYRRADTGEPINLSNQAPPPPKSTSSAEPTTTSTTSTSAAPSTTAITTTQSSSTSSDKTSTSTDSKPTDSGDDDESQDGEDEDEEETPGDATTSSPATVTNSNSAGSAPQQFGLVSLLGALALALF